MNTEVVRHPPEDLPDIGDASIARPGKPATRLLSMTRLSSLYKAPCDFVFRRESEQDDDRAKRFGGSTRRANEMSRITVEMYSASA